jgi:hypothetical protein
MQGGRPQHVMQEGLMTPTTLQHSFMIDHVSDMDGERYQGQFTVRKLSVRDISQIGVRKCQLNGGYHYDEDHPGTGVPPETDWLNQMIAYVETVVIQSPAWFDLNRLYDAKLLGEVFKHASEFETTFFRRKRGHDAGPGSRPDDSSGTDQKPSTAGHIEEVVGGEVPAALEP